MTVLPWQSGVGLLLSGAASFLYPELQLAAPRGAAVGARDSPPQTALCMGSLGLWTMATHPHLVTVASLGSMFPGTPLLTAQRMVSPGLAEGGRHSWGPADRAPPPRPRIPQMVSMETRAGPWLTQDWGSGKAVAVRGSRPQSVTGVTAGSVSATWRLAVGPPALGSPGSGAHCPEGSR